VDLFNTNTFKDNLLPYDGEVHLCPNFLPQNEANAFLETLKATVNWQSETYTMFGKAVTPKRLVAWYADEGLSYTYSKLTKAGLPWNPTLQQLKQQAEQLTGHHFNSCLCNRYHNGQEAMGWHSDNEPELGQQPTIASLSFGTTRRFVFRHKTTKAKVELLLPNGSLCLMKGEVQDYWQHSLPKSAKVHGERINLTFRNVLRSWNN